MKNIVFCLILSLMLSSCDKDSSSEYLGNSSGSGVSGSTATILTYKGFIYTVDNNYLRTLSLHDPSHPVEVSSIFLGEGIETIFAYEDHLYLGTRNGIQLYNISDGAKPVFTGNSFHFPARDPVVVDGVLAYSTTNWGSEDGNGGGTLSVISVVNKNNPITINQLNQEYPCGLGLSGDILYVCNARYGLNVYRTSSNGELNFIKNLPTDPVYDCIAYDKLLICQTKSGIWLFNIEDKANPVFVQRINN